MRGDFSRGHEPDRKRGKAYRRVLLQMGRPVLDSDVAASVDALLGEVRASTRGLGCAAGSPDLGFLVTPGRLLSIFALAADDVFVAEGTPDVWVDHRHRYLDRYPALHVRAAGGRLARVFLPSVQRLRPGGAGAVALWAHVTQAVTVSINGQPVALTPSGGDDPVRVPFTVPGRTLDPVELEVPADGAVWLYLLEEDEDAGADAVFWIAPGTYQVDGLIVDAHGSGSFPSHSFPVGDGFGWDASPPTVPLQGLVPSSLVPGSRFIAYLEVFERHITAVEDPGIREEALGTGDTTTRAQLIGQVKAATIAEPLPLDDEEAARVIRNAFAGGDHSGGTLTIAVSTAAAVTDPCDLPDIAGYSGADNRLYRVEVHHGGPLGQLRLKWSRDNGSELFAAGLDESGNLVFPSGTPLSAGDLVEVLSDVVDLGDDRLAELGALGFLPAESAVGQLVQLAAIDVASSSDQVAFTLVDPDDISVPVALDGRYGVLPDAGLKVRRWHGIVDPRLIATGPMTGPHPIEDGITIELSNAGLYRAGQYWQYEARARQENANGPWRPDPHGPERRFVPLAFLEYQGEDHPLTLVAWFDERFSHLCDLRADDISFDGGRVESTSETVQEALEELFDRTAQWPVIVEDGISWRNDRELAFARFREGLQVTFSEEMHPASATSDTFIVTLEAPDADATPGGRRLVVVDGRVDVDGRRWTFVPAEIDVINIGRWVADLGGSMRCRVRLLGDVILDRAGTRPLDGEAIGRIAEDGYDNFIDLSLPSGTGVRGGDFQSWFYLTAPPGRITIESVEPPDGRILPFGDSPAVVMVSFTDPVRFDTVTGETLVVTRRHSTDPPDVAEPIPGTISPFPFENAPDLVTRVTFAPTDSNAFKPPPRVGGGSWVFNVAVRGSGAAPIVDAERRAIDGARVERASDFSSQFQIMDPRP